MFGLDSLPPIQQDWLGGISWVANQPPFLVSANDALLLHADGDIVEPVSYF
jgi:hypothetical protein